MIPCYSSIQKISSISTGARFVDVSAISVSLGSVLVPFLQRACAKAARHELPLRRGARHGRGRGFHLADER